MVAKAGPIRVRRQPQRTCIGCREATTKRELVRVVRTPESRVVVDQTGKANGRGAYIHADRACWSRALSKDTLGRALRTALGSEDRVLLQAFAETLSASDTPTS